MTPDQLNERRNYYKGRHSLLDYHFDALAGCLHFSDLTNKRVLEIGGSNLPRELVLGDLQCRQWVSVDVIGSNHYALVQQVEHYRTEQLHPLAAAGQFIDSDAYVIFDGRAEDIPDVLHQQFDVVFSVTAFEHILKLPLVLTKIHSCLAPGGLMFSFHGPVWSCFCGHHVWALPDLNFNHLGVLPEFAHLLLRPVEVFELVRASYPLEIADRVVEQMFFSERINRLFYEEYEGFLRLSPFERYVCQPYGIREVAPDLLGRLQALQPRGKDFSAYGVQMVAYR